MVLQDVLIYGSEIWVPTATILALIEVDNMGFYREIKTILPMIQKVGGCGNICTFKESLDNWGFRKLQPTCCDERTK